MEDGVTAISTWQIIVGLLTTVLTTGGVGYLLVEHLLNKKLKHEEVRSQQADNVEKAVSYGVPMIQLYKEIDRIIAEKTDPIMTKLNEATERIRDLEDNYCCYRDSCEMRIRNRKDAERAETVDPKENIERYGRTKGNS